MNRCWYLFPILILLSSCVGGVDFVGPSKKIKNAIRGEIQTFYFRSVPSGKYTDVIIHFCDKDGMLIESFPMVNAGIKHNGDDFVFDYRIPLNFKSRIKYEFTYTVAGKKETTPGFTVMISDETKVKEESSEQAIAPDEQKSPNP